MRRFDDKPFERLDARQRERVRALAEALDADGSAWLRPERGLPRRFGALLRAVERLDCGGDEALLRLSEAGPWVLSIMVREAAEPRLRLPAHGGAPRLSMLMDGLFRGGEAALDEERLLASLHAFDEARPLTMAELWGVGRAARLSLLRGLADAAAEAARSARACARAAAWVERPTGGLEGRDAAFFCHALKLAEDRSLPGAQRLLERHLRSRGILPEEVTGLAHDAQARALVRLNALLDGLRMAEALDGEAAFARLSRVEHALAEDPSGVYPAMDEESRAAVRARTAELAAALGIEELSLARRAVECARGGEGERGTVCWWLAADEGRQALAAGLGGRGVPRLVPDPTGTKCAAALGAGTLLLAAGFAALTRAPWLLPATLPAGSFVCAALAGRIYPRLVRPNRLLKLEFEQIPDEWRTLVVIPALLSSPERVDALCDQLEALGCMEADGNLGFLLLGDFADGPSEHAPSDGEIVDAARARIEAMNRAAGCEQYAYLHRPRTLLAADGRWMGRDRKRGALEDLNRLLLGEPGAEAAFSVEGRACARLRNRYALVVTLDADTRLLPGALHRLAGAMAHPLNRRYAVLQPAMETLPSACANDYARLYAGHGGVSAYPASVSDLWQDATGTGLYAGKGVYRVRAFHDALDGALPEGRVLSHDLIEGTLAGAGFLDDVSFYDGHPATPAAARKRRHRWTRGDWQLLGMLWKGRARNGARLGIAARYRMLDNLLGSLKAPALLALLLAGLWTGNVAALGLGLALCFLEPILSLGRGDSAGWRRAALELSLLPVEAASQLDAVLRTLWRLGVSGRHLLDWTTAADAEGMADAALLPALAGALLAIPGLAGPMRLAAAGLLLLWSVGPGWARDLAARDATDVEAPSRADEAEFERLARETWRFFEDNVDPATCPLPPDNVQLDPPVGAARRTSPTNIGLYLASCLAARRLGFVGTREMERRMDAAVAAMEGMEKWRGHLYNWIDLDALSPLPPRYVSSVDSGNLAACLLLCAAAPEVGEELASRMRALAEGMDFSALYDGKRRLFAIGLEADAGRLSRSHYDLLASESRLMSFTAMLLGQVPPEHWRALGRACASAEGAPVLLSWSGTMFEYLLPELFMPAPACSLLGVGVRGAVRAQRALGRRLKRPWGVSESGCCAFDGQLNYQYQAYGLPALSLSGSASTGVVAPYACALAASLAPRAAAENLRAMRNLGWAGRWGFYEAADYLRGEGGEPALVKSCMAHHQGMALCALCNALTGNSLARDFMARPRARALALLLEERAPVRAPRRAGTPGAVREAGTRDRSAAWHAQPGRRLAETHVLAGAGATVLVTMDGAAHYARDGVLATRFAGDLLNRGDAACVHALDVASGEDAVLGGRALLLPGAARFRQALRGAEAEMKLCVSPEDGALLKTVALKNTGRRPRCFAVTDVEPVALAPEGALRAHAIFQNLFVEAERIAPNALCFRRRPRAEGERFPRLLHAAWGGDVESETDLDRLAGRMGNTGRPGGISMEPGGACGAGLNPASALRVRVRLAPGEEKAVRFLLCLADDGRAARSLLDRYAGAEGFSRAMELSRARADAVLRFLGLDAGRHMLLMRLAALLADGRLAAEARGGAANAGPAPREALWALGLSGDRPVLTMFASDPGQSAPVRALLRAHEFYRGLGVDCDLALVNDGPAGYDRPVRDMLSAQLDSSALAGLRGAPGGVWLLDGASMGAAQRAVLVRGSSACFDAGRDFYAQVRALLSALDVPAAAEPPALDIGASTLPPLGAANGYGRFDGRGGYEIDVLPGRTTPAPWCNILAGERGGALLTERGGGFLWHGGSRSGRMTRYGNDSLREGWGLMLWLSEAKTGARLMLLPGDRPARPFRVRYDASSATYAFAGEKLAGETRFELDGADDLIITLSLANRTAKPVALELAACADWLMGADAGDGVRLNAWHADGACFATGAMPGVGILAMHAADVRPCAGRAALLGRGGVTDPGDAPGAPGGWGLKAPVRLEPNGALELRLAVAWAEDADAAQAWAEAFRRAGRCAPRQAEAPALALETPDPVLDELFNHWLLHQVRASRVLGRTGFYQPGGAYGFRDQLQDMLALIPEEPARVRAHLLRCAARQFEAGDVLHWWHEPYRGVRTRIADDLLFLPWVAAEYARQTGDASVFAEQVPWLEDAPIPEGASELYAEMRPTEGTATLHEHCMRAFRRAAAQGGHGLSLMGVGDWNDGMNRVGAAGKGESVWLSEFTVACAQGYLDFASDPEDRRWLESLIVRLRVAVEQRGWDGGWYLRAYDDRGNPLGGSACDACRIDAISQAWAELAGLDDRRCGLALDAAWAHLVDERLGIVKLLTPPFGEEGTDPGYIRAYPAGVRENGGQYTHGALWLLLALIHRGDAARAHRMLRMLLPCNHAGTPGEAERYRVEPYAVAADVSASPDCPGRGGWTWYTGSAAWMRVCVLALLGYERRGDRVRLNALLGDWPGAALVLRCGGASYRLVADRRSSAVTLDGRQVGEDFIRLVDDGKPHEARFPARKA